MHGSKLKQFVENDDGAITAFVVVMFLTMVVGGGMGVDFMRHEAERAALQDALDHGVLAAASYGLPITKLLRTSQSTWSSA